MGKTWSINETLNYKNKNYRLPLYMSYEVLLWVFLKDKWPLNIKQYLYSAATQGSPLIINYQYFHYQMFWGKMNIYIWLHFILLLDTITKEAVEIHL